MKKYAIRYSELCTVCAAALAFMLLQVMCSTVFAHKVSIYAYAEDGMIYARGYFVDGTRARDASIEVLDAKSGGKLLDLKTDEKGEASFKIPETAALKLVMTASMGHRNDYTISVEEVMAAMGITGERVSGPGSEDRMQKSEGEIQNARNETGNIYKVQTVVSRDDLEAIVDSVVEKKILPLKNILLDIQEELSSPGMSQVIAGIGYLVGIMGIILYFKCRRP